MKSILDTLSLRIAVGHSGRDSPSPKLSHVSCYICLEMMLTGSIQGWDWVS